MLITTERDGYFRFREKAELCIPLFPWLKTSDWNAIGCLASKIASLHPPWKRGQEPIAKRPEGCCALLVPDPFSKPIQLPLLAHLIMESSRGDLAILAGSGNPQFAKRIADSLGVKLTPCEAQIFSEGNVFVRILENVRGRDTFVIQGVHRPVNDNFVELLFWIDALKRASASQITAVIPYFSYAKGDKKDEPRVSIRARVCADAIEAAGADRVLTMDLHSPQIQGFFSVPVDHLYARSVICDHIKALNIPNLVICSPDADFANPTSGLQITRFGIFSALIWSQMTDRAYR